MNITAPLRHAFTLLFFVTFIRAADSPAIDVVRLRYIEATVAYERVKSDYPDISAVVTGIEIGTNAVALDTSDPRASEVRKRLEAIDVKPRSVVLSATIVETDEAHAQTPSLDPVSDRILSRPTVFVLEDKPAVVYSKRGADGKVLKVIVTSKSVAEVAKK